MDTNLLVNFELRFMKKYILTMGVLLAVFTANAQFTLRAEYDFASGSAAESELVTKAYVKNTGATEVEYVWVKEKIGFPGNWNAAICDKNICYDTPVDTAHFTLAAGDSGNLDVHTYPQQTSGIGRVKVTVYAVGDEANAKVDTFTFSAWALSAKKVQRNDIEVYPNPATTKLTINLETSKPVTMEVYNVLGQLKMTHVHNGKTSTLDVESLPAGMYFIRYTTDGGQVVSKQFKKIQ